MWNILIRVFALVFITISAILTSPTILNSKQEPQAYEGEVGSDVQKKNTLATIVTIKAKKDDRKQRLETYLTSNGSPLAPYSREFIKIADKYGLDWRLLPAIAGVESTFGLYVPSGSYNPYGWNNGNFYFRNWVASTDYVASQIKSRWGSLAPITPWNIGPSYAASPTWAYRVSKYMGAVSLN